MLTSLLGVQFGIGLGIFKFMNDVSGETDDDIDEFPTNDVTKIALRDFTGHLDFREIPKVA